MSNGAIFLDDDGKPILAGIDPTTHKIVHVQVTTTGTDSVTGAIYGTLATSGGGGGGGISTNDGTFAKETGGNLASIKTDLDSVVTNTANIIAKGVATKVNSWPVNIASDQTVPISGTITSTTNADTTIGGTTAPTKELLIAGKTNDGTPQYQPLPEGAGGRSVIVEGISGGVAIPISGSITATNPSVATDGSTLPTSSTLMGASDGTNLQQLLVESSTNRNLRTGIYSGANEATVTGSNALKVDNSAVTQPVSGTVSVNALPTGTNTVGNVGLIAGTAVIGGVELVDSAGTNKAAISAVGAVKVDNSAVTQPVSASSLPLPTGASTSAKQPAIGTAGTASSDVLTVQGISSMTPLKVDASATTQPVSGTVTANAGTGNFTVAQSTGSNLHSVVDSGAITATTNADTTIGGTTAPSKELLIGGKTNDTTPQYQPLPEGAGGRSVIVEGISGGVAIPVSGSITATNPSVGTDGLTLPTSSTLIGASDGTNLQQLLVESATNRNLRTSIYSGANEATVTGSNALKVDNSAVTQPISASSLPLPTSAATSAKQPALGTAGTASSDVLTVQGITSMTPLKTDGSGVTQPVSGTVTSNIGTTNGLALDTSINGILVSQGSTTSGEKGALIQGAVTSSAPTYTTAQTSPISLTTAGAVRTDASATTQPVSASSLPLPTGASTSAKQPALGTAGTASADVLSVQGVTSMTPLKVDGSGVTQPVSGAITANAGTNLNTSTLALESGGNLATVAGAITSAKVQTNVAQINGVTPTMGNGVSGTGVQRVTLASDSTGQVTLAASSAVIGHVINDASSAVIGHVIVDSVVTNADTTIGGTVAPAKELLIAGKTNDGTPQYQPLPEGAGGRSVIVEGVSGGTAIPVSGTVTANVGTTNGLALDTSINGILVSQGSASSGEKGVLIQGAVTSAAPAYTTAQTSPISLTTTGAVRTDASATTQPISGTISVNALPTGANTIGAVTQASGPWTNNLTQIGGNSVVTGGANGLLAVSGPVASGSTNADNPLKTGGVYNSTQPTVSTGQIVDAQYTARGANIVATGTDTFNATINTALPAGTNVIGHVINDAGSAVIGSVLLQSASGTALVADQSNSELRTSIYVKTTTAGDTALALGQATKVNSLSVALASDMGNLGVSGTVTANAGTGNYNSASVGTDGSAIPASSTLIGASDGTNLQQLLVESATNRNLRVGIYNAANELAIDSGGRTTSVMQVTAGTALATGNNAVPILNSASTGAVAAYASNAAALTANTDFTFKWGASGTTQVNHIMIQNNSSVVINWDLDAATSVGSPILSNVAGANTLFLDIQTSILHIQANGTPNVNGTTTGNIVVRGWI